MILRINPFLLLGAGFGVLGCSTGAGLHPAKSAQTVAPNVAQAQAAGVLVQARGNVWPGDSDVLDHVTPLQIWIENRGDQAVQVRYSGLSLRSADGQTFRALPPWEITGTVEMNVSVVPKSGPEAKVASRTARYAYPDVDAKPPLPIRTLPYYDYLYDNWTADIPLPTEDMKQVALPEALLEPRGAVSGFVYFERVPKKEREYVTLNVELVNAGTDAILGRAEIPFVH